MRKLFDRVKSKQTAADVTLCEPCSARAILQRDLVRAMFGIIFDRIIIPCDTVVELFLDSIVLFLDSKAFLG